MYYQGQGVRQNYVEAARWCRKASEQGDPIAQVGLGLAYANGEGVPQDYVEAARWYRKAAEQEDADAQYTLGTMYSDGRGVPQNYVEANMWVDLAVSLARGDDQKRYAGMRELIAKKMTSQQIGEAQRRTREWKSGRKN
jgi:uncharacterized protein